METRDLRYAMRALSDTARLRIIQYLATYDQEVTVTDLTKALRISQPLASWHLRQLRRAQLVSTRRVGRQVLCSLNRKRLTDLSLSIATWCERKVAAVLQTTTAYSNTTDTAVLQRGVEP